MRYLIPLVGSGVSSSWMCPEDLHKEVTRWGLSLILQPPQLSHFSIKEQCFYPELPDVWAPHPILRAKSNHPTKESKFLLPVSTIPSSRSHDTELVAISKCWNAYRLVNLEIGHLFISDSFVFISVQDSFAKGSSLPPTRREQYTKNSFSVFQLKGIFLSDKYLKLQQELMGLKLWHIYRFGICWQ